MSDWLGRLKKHKQRAIEEAQATLAKEEIEKQAKLQELRAGQDKIVAILRDMRVERLLLQLAHDIIAGHPRFPSAKLHRSMDYEREDVFLSPYPEDKGYAPGYLWPTQEATPLPDDLHIPDGYCLTRVCWHFGLYTVTNYPYEFSYFLEVSVTAKGLEISKQAVSPLAVENVQKSLVAGIESPLLRSEYIDRSP